MRRTFILSLFASAVALAQTSITATNLIDRSSGQPLNGSVCYFVSGSAPTCAAVTSGALATLSASAGTYTFNINGGSSTEYSFSYPITGSGSFAVDAYMNGNVYATLNGSVFFLTGNDDWIICSGAPVGLPATPSGGQKLTVLNIGMSGCSVTGSARIGNTSSPVITQVVPPGVSAQLKYDGSNSVWRIQEFPFWFGPSSGPIGITGQLMTYGLSAPGPATVTPIGTTGSTTWHYQVVAVQADGSTSSHALATESNGAAILNGSNYNQIAWTPVSGAACYSVLRVSAAGSPSSTGYIAQCVPGTSLNDTGLVGDSSPLPPNNAGNITAGNTLAYQGALQAESASASATLGQIVQMYDGIGTNTTGAFSMGNNGALPYLEILGGLIDADISGNVEAQTYAEQLGSLITVSGSGVTIAPTTSFFHIAGSGTISTVTPVSPAFGPFYGCYDVIADAAWSTITGGNQGTIFTATAGYLYRACWDGTSWYWSGHGI